jgi:alpha-tubulin suppressor-like RCC1 family protein
MVWPIGSLEFARMEPCGSGVDSIKQGSAVSKFGLEPEQVGLESNWVSASTSGGHSVALKCDGTIWEWGNNTWGRPGSGAVPNPTNVVQIGTNRDWAQLICLWQSTAGLRSNGTLWVWGQVHGSGGQIGPMKINNFQTPTQVCRETNWIGLGLGSGPLAWTSSGEVWQPITTASPDAEASVAVTGELIATNSAPNRLIFAISGTPKLYELRVDGTIWEKEYALAPWSSKPTDTWHRFGKRSDWVGIWSVSQTALGLTSDGTIWTWGVDLSQGPKPAEGQKLMLLMARIRAAFGGNSLTGFAGTRSSPLRWASQKEPRPLMRMVGPGEKK